MKSTINISPKARADLVEIWNYSARVHGPAAADSYVIEIDRVMILALQYSEIGSDYSDIRQGYRKLRSGSHLIFYIPHDGGIEIIRVLHQQADIPERLAD